MSTHACMMLNRAQQRLPHGHNVVTTIASSVWPATKLSLAAHHD